MRKIDKGTQTKLSDFLLNLSFDDIDKQKAGELAARFGSVEAIVLASDRPNGSTGGIANDRVKKIVFWIFLRDTGLKIVQTLLDQIDRSKDASLPRVIYGLGIRHVGRATADSLAVRFGSLKAISAASKEDLMTVPDIGTEVADAIVKWFVNEKNLRLIEKLKQHGVNPSTAKKESEATGHLAGKTFVITGELPGMSREEAEELVRKEGGKAASSVSSKTSYLVAGESPGATKLKAAREHGTTIIDFAEFRRILGKKPSQLGLFD
jgi:NAD-dependent DNA ligase